MVRRRKPQSRQGRPRRRSPKSATRASTRARRPGAQPVVTIRTLLNDGRIEASVSRDAPLKRLAEEWTYLLRVRTRWADDADLRLAVRERALEGLRQAGISKAFVGQLAQASHVEVELHDWNPKDAEADEIHEAAADVPWEYLISAGTRGVGRYESLLITRLFRNRAPAMNPAPPERVLFIESAPGRLEEIYDFSSERVRIQAAVGANQAKTMSQLRTERSLGSTTPGRLLAISETETVDTLAETVRLERWDVLHVTGVDTHQVGWYLPSLYEELKEDQPEIWRAIIEPPKDDPRIRDGMLLRRHSVPELPVPFDQLAQTMINPRNPPWLVTLNLYYSGTRTAREMVKRGARAALGFLDEIDDELAERFFQAFYRAWCHDGASTISRAFMAAWHTMSGNRLHGTAIVIWMGRSVFDDYDEQARPLTSSQAEGTRAALLQRIAEMSIDKVLHVDFEVPEEVNYSLLHNERPLVSTLTLTKLVNEPLEDIAVVVELNLGTQNYPFRTTELVLDQPQLALASDVRIPLTATLPRSLRERVQSTVYVKVTCQGRTAYEKTKPVTLIPVDEWLDDTDKNPWLPSFVLPRDPAVLKIITASRRYLVGIEDDPAAGFDGYQSVDPDAENPTHGVDSQVQAIWTALVNDFRLQYINPPPSYSDQTQRLRTPSDILESSSGTCVDLALLLASCLEYIDIFPVVVLLEGHAFAGYWRSEEAHDAFIEVKHVPSEVPPAGSAVVREAGVRLVEEYGWRLTKLHYDEIMEYVTSGDLVFLEATFLTSASSFADAVKEGRADMRSKREFDSLLDVKLARTASPPVTPLPVINA